MHFYWDAHLQLVAMFETSLVNELTLINRVVRSMLSFDFRKATLRFYFQVSTQLKESYFYAEKRSMRCAVLVAGQRSYALSY
ncbi:hypothetical protein CS912_00340 (plasmid) [Klebsiella variicola]|uniref:Uncharacterized protein n=1 Tax=Klebsiella pneumoniae TaxID=573 RepID=A0A6M6A2F1_KLEPN|nr:hypothetical protein CS911_00535 [Klebsiella variicola]QJX12079.1 hypothetical protein [Klebsiella pneumoniae]UOL51893.1 hypothetical protein NDJJOOAI_00367 [Escherichia coli]PIA12296.1 hypothetical protein CS912_00340 [Klebsiella variicola]QAA75292.1 hypothetical protein D4N21_27915 [Klebsiella variicola]